jgi:hypothetical protein
MHDALDLGLGLGQEKFLQLSHGPVFDLCVLGLVGGQPEQFLQVVLQQRVLVEIFDLGVCQKGLGIFPCCFIIGPDPDSQVSLLEGICSPYHLLIEGLVKASLDSTDVREDVLAMLYLFDRSELGIRRRVRNKRITCKGDTRSSHH